MRMYENAKYEYWKWVLLNKHTKLVNEKEHRNLIAVHNPTENIMYRFDLDKCKKIKTHWEGIDWLFDNCLADFIKEDEVDDFYNALPNSKKEKFWKCMEKSRWKN